jgi:hypothetical protein
MSPLAYNRTPTGTPPPLAGRNPARTTVRRCHRTKLLFSITYRRLVNLTFHNAKNFVTRCHLFSTAYAISEAVFSLALSTPKANVSNHFWHFRRSGRRKCCADLRAVLILQWRSRWP